VAGVTPEIRELTRAEIEPHIPMLLADGFTPEIEQGVWYGALVDGELRGFVRLFDEGGNWMLEDVYVFEPYRRQGLASRLIDHARRGIGHLWLICDDETIGFYNRRGFELAAKEDFPLPLATFYQAKHEWPTAPDHNHNAMRWPGRVREGEPRRSAE